MWNAAPAQVAGQIFNKTPAIIIVEPVFQVMQPRKIIASAFAAAVSIRFDVMQQTFRSPIRFWFVQHSGETEGDLKKGPTIHSLKIYRRRFDPVVDLKSEMLVTRSYQCLPDCGGPFPNWQGFPIPGFRFCDQSIELVLSFKDRAERQPRFRGKRDGTKQKQGNQNLPTSHNRHNSSRNG